MFSMMGARSVGGLFVRARLDLPYILRPNYTWASIWFSLKEDLEKDSQQDGQEDVTLQAYLIFVHAQIQLKLELLL